MSTAVRLDADRWWTFDDLAELPEDIDWRRCEIVDGTLVVSPHPRPVHELLVSRLLVALAPSVPPGFEVIGSSMIDLEPSYRVPDVAVVSSVVFGREAALVQPSDVLLAVEIESPSSITTDRITKPAQYAAAGIPHFWRLEIDPLVLHAYRLAGDAYERTGSWSAAETVRASEPFELDVDLASFLPPAGQ